MTGCVISSDDDDVPDATLTVHNESSYDITEIYLTDVGNPDWGRNLIAGDVLQPDEQLTLSADCGTYDAKVIDETDVDCVVPDVDLCLNDADWVIRNNTCHVSGVEKAIRDAKLAASRQVFAAAKAAAAK